MTFDNEQLQDAARYFHSQGIERTPAQVEAIFTSMICDMRRWHPDKTRGLSDAAVWLMILDKLGIVE